MTNCPNRVRGETLTDKDAFTLTADPGRDGEAEVFGYFCDPKDRDGEVSFQTGLMALGAGSPLLDKAQRVVRDPARVHRVDAALRRNVVGCPGRTDKGLCPALGWFQLLDAIVRAAGD